MIFGWGESRWFAAKHRLAKVFRYFYFNRLRRIACECDGVEFALGRMG